MILRLMTQKPHESSECRVDVFLTLHRFANIPPRRNCSAFVHANQVEEVKWKPELSVSRMLARVLCLTP